MLYICTGNGQTSGGRTDRAPRHQTRLDCWRIDTMSPQHLGCDAVSAVGLGSGTSWSRTITDHYWNIGRGVCNYNTVVVSDIVSL